MNKIPQYIALPENALYKEIDAIEWFSHLFESPIGNTEFVSNTQEIIEIHSDLDFENFLLERQSDLSVFLSINRKREKQDWNIIVEHSKQRLSSAFSSMRSKAKILNFTQEVIDSVEWDIIGYMQEQAYRKVKKPGYFTTTFSYYKQGRLPCGFSGSYPEGVFKVA